MTRAAHAGGLSLAPVVQGAPAPTLPRAGATVCLVGAEGEVYVRVVHANADRVVVSYYGRPLAITSRSTRWRLSPDPWAPALAPLLSEPNVSVADSCAVSTVAPASWWASTATAPAPLPGEVCPSPTLPAEEVADVG